MSIAPRMRAALIVLAVGLLACAYVAFARVHYEREARRVELVMDYTDFNSLARSYNYDQTAFLVALRRAGLTSLAVQEQLGSGVNASQNAVVYAGQTLIDQARLAPLGDPLFAALAKAGRLSADEVYLVVYDAATWQRFRSHLAIDFEPRAVRVLRNRAPYVIAVKTQSDFFSNVSLGIPLEVMDWTKRLGFLLVPRVQNDERFGASQIDATFRSFLGNRRVSTVIFFGLRNQVLGYPKALDATADAFKRTRLNFGTIETYDAKQVQDGNDDLARKIPGQTTRVQAIAKLELDKLKPENVVARYLLGARERNVRVVYLRPFAHAWGDRSIEATNVEIVRQVADGLKARGFKLGRATPIPPFRINPIVVALASLAVPGILLVLFALFGIGNLRFVVALVVLDLLFYGGTLAIHHEMLARKVLALVGGIAFAVSGVCMTAPIFRSTTAARSTLAAMLAGLRVLVVALGTTLGGALVIVGLLSTPLFMEEIDRFTGVKLVLLLPPLIALALYLLTPLFAARLDDPRDAVNAPIRIYQLVAGGVLLAVAYLVLVRSGNQSDIAPSAFELALRSNLTVLLSVRPRFKEFVLGFPLLMLLPVLQPIDRKRFGWLLVLGIGTGLADCVDTFSHLHTALGISLLRIANGAVLGILIGALAIVVYRALRSRFAADA